MKKRKHPATLNKRTRIDREIVYCQNMTSACTAVNDADQSQWIALQKITFDTKIATTNYVKEQQWLRITTSRYLLGHSNEHIQRRSEVYEYLCV